MESKVYEFVVKIVGHGDSEQEAWEDAKESALKKVDDNSYDDVNEITFDDD